jgi:hypothetical protein
MNILGGEGYRVAGADLSLSSGTEVKNSSVVTPHPIHYHGVVLNEV